MLAEIAPDTLGIVLLIGLILFGGSKIPELARSLGRARSEFRKGIAEGAEDAEEPDEEKRSGG